MRNGLRLVGLAMLSLALWGCNDSSDNLDQIGYYDFPNFPGIDTSEISEEAHAPAAMTLGDGLDYQAALIYEVVLNLRGFHALEWPVDESLGGEDCELDGSIFYDQYEKDVGSPHLGGVLPIEHINAYGCTRELPTDPDATYTTVGQFAFSETETTCDGGTCDVGYGSFGGIYPYRVLYQDPAGEPNRTRSRVQVEGYYYDGPNEIDEGGGPEEVLERTQRLVLVNSVQSIVADEVDSGKVFGLIYGAPGERFKHQQVSATDEVILEGELASGSDGGAECVGGEMTVATNARLELDGAGNIVAGEVELTNDEDTPETATLEFQPATGDVFVTDNLGGTQTYSRAAIEALRDTCFQTIEVLR